MNQEKNQKNQENKKWLTLLAGKEVAEVDLELIWETKILRRELEYRRYPPILESKILANALAKSKPVDPNTVPEPITTTTPTWQPKWLSALFYRNNKGR
jgi:hypothetical protein